MLQANPSSIVHPDVMNVDTSPHTSKYKAAHGTGRFNQPSALTHLSMRFPRSAVWASVSSLGNGDWTGVSGAIPSIVHLSVGVRVQHTGEVGSCGSAHAFGARRWVGRLTLGPVLFRSGTSF